MGWEVIYIMPLSLDPGEGNPDKSVVTGGCVFELASDLGFPVRLDGE
jgi:hypothetical protein